jgi:transposase
MSSCPKSIPSIPKETLRAANAILGRNNFYIVLGESLEAVLENTPLHYSCGKEGASPTAGTTESLITFFQFVEVLTDIQAADAVRTRIDWKFALHLSLIPARFDERKLCQFRQWIWMDAAGQHEFQTLIDRVTRFVPSLKNNFQNLTSLEVIAAVCSMNRLHHAQQTMNRLLEILATQFPDWLRKVALPHWYGRYSHETPRFEVAILRGRQQFLMEEIRTDIHHLLRKIDQSGPREIGELEEVRALHQVWSHQFEALNFVPGHWAENLKVNACDTCPYKMAERRN